MKKPILFLVLSIFTSSTMPARADEQGVQPPGNNRPMTAEEKTQKRALLLQQLEAIKAELNQLDNGAPAATTATEKTPSTSTAHGEKTLGEVVVVSSKPRVFERPSGQTVTTVDRDKYKNSQAFSIGDIVTLTPGVTVSQGNGPRDISISIRGSNARVTFAVRNIQVLEDGFPVTQPDGLARTDLIDPHAYGNIDVFQGPSSALFGNYATGGAINFQTRPGDDIRGAELGIDAGSFGYRNEYVTIGNKKDRHEYTLFASHISGDGNTSHTGFNTNTQNFIASYTPTANDKFTFKFANNDLDTDLSIRLSLNQYNLNPYQKGCAVPAAAAAGCASINLFNNGFNNSGGTTATSAEQAGLGRRDRRTIAGARWEHAFDADTTWRTQFLFDNRDIKQPTGTTDAVGTFPSFNVISDVSSNGKLYGMNATHYVGVFANYENNNAQTFNVVPPGSGAPGATAPGGKSQVGGLTNTTWGTHLNYGARAREELAFNPQWKGVLGVGVEETSINALSTNFAYPAAASPTTTQITADRSFFNFAPEAALIFMPNDQWTLHARVSTAYGTPQISNLFVTPQGINGNNTQLQSQTTVGYELGTDWMIGGVLKATLLGFYEEFTNELVNQSPGAGLLTYTFNAPHSVHRGLEAAADWHPLPNTLPGALFSLSYLLDQQYYTEYIERLSAGAQSTAFDRSGNDIPGVAPQYLHLRLGYDQPTGELRGLGGFVDFNRQEGYFVDNANLVKIPSYSLVNLNLHYNRDLDNNFVSSLNLFFEVRNLLNETYVASASNITDSISAATGLQNPASTVSNAGGSIWAGSPRSFFGGARLKF